jgi:Putative DNA-binding domain
VTAGTTELAGLHALLEEEGDRLAYVRALLRPSTNGWQLLHLWALVGLEPPRWSEQTWQYDGATLVSTVISPADLAPICSGDDPGNMVISGFSIEVPKAQGPVPWRREPSFARLDRMLLSRPTTNYDVAPAKHDRSSAPSRPLVGTECPSFLDLEHGWAAFVEDDFTVAKAHRLPVPLATIRIADSRGWIDQVHVAATEATVAVHGDGVAGGELELYGATGSVSQPLDGPGTVTFPLVDGLPQDAWLWLKHGTTWLDYRSIDPGSDYTGELERAGVDIEVPIEPQANIEALIAAGEGPHVEFKEQLPHKRQLKTVAAFASGRGGSMVFGINRDEMTITGLNGDDGPKLRDHVADLIRAAVIPTPDFTVADFIIDGKIIVVVEVPPGQTPPYGLIANSNSRDRPEYYVRRGANTYPAQPNDLRESVIRRLER